MNDTSSIAEQSIPFEFNGKASEYFGIWIVNVLLIIVTLGIYSAWAKVRTKRYFYGATFLDGSNFDFLADPLAILKGWAIGVVAFVIYSTVTNFYPFTAPLFAILLLLCIPWIVVRAMMFRLRNTSYRNLRFHFNKNYSQAARAYILFALLVPFTLGLIIPYMIHQQKKFLVDNSNFGKAPFEFSGTASSFYIVYLIAGGIMFFAMMAVSILMPIIIASLGIDLPQGGAPMTNGATEGDPEANKAAVMVSLSAMVLFMGFYLFVYGYIQASVSNLIWNNTRLNEHGFNSTLHPVYMVWLYVSNTIAIVCSLGLLIPWAKIRVTRYRLDNLKLVPNGDLQGFIASETDAAGATGEELGEVFGIDIGL
jgi:uncharacterized membrane protein YjgN (DUF898 family)